MVSRTYLRAIGISEGNIDALMTLVRNANDHYHAHSRDTESIYVEFDKAFGNDFGLKLRYVLNSGEEIVGYEYQPYCNGSTPKGYVNIEIQSIDGEHIVIAEDADNGNELVFSLQNPFDFTDGISLFDTATITLAGLSSEATIILPVLKDEESERMRLEEESERREQLCRAREGDMSALQKLEQTEEALSGIIQERLINEDFLTVVEGFFMPTDDDDTQYSILGDITSITERTNSFTGERMYVFGLNVTGSPIDVCVNIEDVRGLPSVGMRFLGSCWLQGRLKVEGDS